MDPLEDNATPKEESDVVNISISDVQKDAEASMNKQSLEETRGVKCDSEGLILTEPEKSHQDGRVCHVLRYSSTAQSPAGDVDQTDPLPELCSSLQEESDEVSLSSSDVQEDGEDSDNIEGLEKTQGAECDSEGLIRISKSKSTDRDKGDYTCSTCGKAFNCSSSLCRHRKLHTGEKPHVCHLCGVSFSRKYHLDRHMQIHTGKVKIRSRRDRERSYSCDLCEKSFYHIDTLQEHRKRHSEFRPFKCDQCNKDFKVNSDFLKHQQTHTGLKPHSELTIDEYEPSELARWFMDPLEDNATPKEESDVVNISISDVQKDAEASMNKQSLEETQGVKCDSEGLILTEPETSHQDGRVCHVLRYSSTAQSPAGEADATDSLPELCSSLQEESDEVSLSSSDVQEDGEDSDNIEGLEETQGAKCDAEVSIPKKSHQDGRVCHVLRYRKPDEPTGTLAKGSRHLSTSEKRKLYEKGSFPCPTCGKVFTWNSNLAKHKLLHTGERPYVCRLCGKAFFRSDHLSIHMRIHDLATGEKKSAAKVHTCSKCGKSFSRFDTLRSHLRRHEEERPFTCDICHKSFKVQHDLMCHQRIHSDYHLVAKNGSRNGGPLDSVQARSVTG
ncbi:zinc finger protein 773-like [Engraulis encrasicolus]|uniref:zinc finger protein 773-like n=1 Tax=Engraulis encrasicolus TaxID=184585 RepID=UPI002FD72FB9